jgi:hypothetical protein
LISSSGNIAISIGTYLASKVKKKYQVYILLLLFNYSIKIIVISTFLFDIIIYNQFYYFYKILFILTIPLIFSYTLYSLNDLSNQNILRLSKDLQIFHNNILLTPFDFTFKQLRSVINLNEYSFKLTQACKINSLPEGFNLNDFNDNVFNELTAYYINLYFIYHRIFKFCFNVNYILDLNKNIFNLFIYSLYIFGWSYIIFILYKPYLFIYSTELKVIAIEIIIYGLYLVILYTIYYLLIKNISEK